MTETAETAAPVNWSKGQTPLLDGGSGCLGKVLVAFQVLFRFL